MSSKILIAKLKNSILNDKYELSLVFTTAKKIQNLNRIYRKINEPTDILSFPLSKNSGEIFICKTEARRMAKEFGRQYENFLDFLLIHGLVHLKGYDHGPKMEKLEKGWRKKFGI